MCQAVYRPILAKHPEIEKECSKGGTVNYLTTENPEKFKETASVFTKEDINVRKIELL